MPDYPNQRRLAQERYDVKVRADDHLIRVLEDIFPRLDALIAEAEAAQDNNVLAQLRQVKSQSTANLQAIRHNRVRGMNRLRNELQKRYTEEASLLSWIKIGDQSLPPDICKRIAGINNVTAEWDTPLAAPKFYEGKHGKRENVRPRI